MPLTTTGELVTSAAATHSALASFNVITLEHVEAVIAGAESVRAPVVLQVSENAVTFHGGHLLPLARAAVVAAEHAAVPVALHLDHVRSDTLLHQAADAGFSSVMYDAARLPYAENLAATRAAVDRAHAQGLWIEAELGQIGGKNGRPPLDAHAPGARTDPDEARVFVADSGVDALAVAIGSSHAMTTRTAALDHALLKRLSAALDVPLVLHGSSGVPDDELTAAVAGGITKVNIGTALNIALTGAIRDFLAERPEAVDPRSYLTLGREAMTRAVARTLQTLGAATA
ncbi:class II fructose-bisphosphate aldolase [Streptomyces luteogriseus]|uniref:class II fructose-bisphosphate aldolase n=1 Tax=Streptomyces luteogriseus TaxID=68233 RepID=UPI002E32C955|nr:class II fructose-bisphosphate aldolase [Streptomyces luteogriseus]WTJ32385.1 class II fructose-bisphosphate aldolase family protein [Streptomyces luteogriseus]